MGEIDWKVVNARKGCNFLTRDDLLMGKVPTTPTSASVIAGVQCQEALKLLHGLEVLSGKGFIFNGLTHDSYVVEYERKNNCNVHDTFETIRKLRRSTLTTTLRTLLDEVKAELGQSAVIEFNKFDADIVESLVCPKCADAESIFRPLGKVTESDGVCKQCGTIRNPITFKNIHGGERFIDQTFADIGIPPFEIVTGRAGQRRIFLEFDTDAPQVLGTLAT